MKVVHVRDGVPPLGASSIEVSQPATRTSDVLALGEHVLVQTAAGEIYAAQVVSMSSTWWERVYELALGARLPHRLAMERLAGLDPARHDLALHEVVDLLGELARDRTCGPRRGPLRTTSKPAGRDQETASSMPSAPSVATPADGAVTPMRTRRRRGAG